MTLDRKITYGLIFAVVLEAAAALIWAGGAAERLSDVEQRLAEHRTVAERLARLEAETAAVRRQLDRIERQVVAREN